MKLTKGQGVSFFAAIVAFAVFSVSLFVLPIDKNIVFWLGYIFATYALVVMLVSLFKYFNKQVKEEQFLNMPVIVLSWIFLASQMYLSYREITTLFLPYKVALLANLVTGLVFTVLILAVTAATNKIEKNDAKVIEKILYMDILKNELKAIDSSDVTLRKKIDSLIDDVTYSDPMSHSRLAEIENRILQKTRELSDNTSDVTFAVGLCDEISKLIKNRNNQCLTLKKVKDTSDVGKDSENGNKIAIAGVGVALCVVLAVATLVLYIVPEIQYKNACDLMNDEKYDEAIALFEDLGEYKDSPDKIEEIDTMKKDAEYDSAIQLMDDAKYEDAIDAFTNLNGYRDSNEKINEIGEIIYQEKYASAEEAFSAGDYEKALSLYKEMTLYKDSRDRIVEINNRLSSDDIMYLGTYKSEAISWKIVEFNGYDRALLLAEKPIRNLPISDDIADVSYEESDIAKWLDEEFTVQFTDKDFSKIIETDGQKVFLLSDDDVERLKNNGVDLTTDSDWWIRTESSIGFKFVSSDGDVSDAGDIHLRDKGVRPAIWINLK